MALSKNRKIMRNIITEMRQKLEDLNIDHEDPTHSLAQQFAGIASERFSVAEAAIADAEQCLVKVELQLSIAGQMKESISALMETEEEKKAEEASRKKIEKKPATTKKTKEKKAE